MISATCFSQECNADVKINTDIKNFRLYVNNILQQNSESLKLPDGNYILKLAENDGKWDSKEITDTITVQNCNTLNLSYRFNEDKLLIETVPADAHIFVNDSVIGFTPLLLPVRYNSIKLSKENYNDKILSVNELSSTQKIKLEYIGDGPEYTFYGSPKFWILAGTAVALGAATAYFKLKADDKFDEYQVTGDPGLLNETDKYDLFSGVTFTAMQIDFGAIIYFFLTE